MTRRLFFAIPLIVFVFNVNLGMMMVCAIGIFKCGKELLRLDDAPF